MLAVLLAASAATALAPALIGEREPRAVRMGGAGLDRLVQRLLSTLPGPGSGGYDRARRAEAAALRRAYTAARAGDAARSQRLAAPLGYVVRPLGEGSMAALALAEPPEADGAPGHGWGLFVHAARAPTDLAVEVVHPRADAFTALMGLLAFRATGARDLLIAGAHRAADADGSADVAHASSSAFQAAHLAVLHPGVTVVQLHGFDARGRSPGYGDAVVSDGTPEPSAPARALARTLRATGLRVCLYRGERCSPLAGTTNVQGRATRAAGGAFIHLELALRLRREPGMRARVIRALVGALGAASRK